MKDTKVYTTITYRGSETNPMVFRVGTPQDKRDEGFGYLSDGGYATMKVRREWIIELAEVLKREA